MIPRSLAGVEPEVRVYTLQELIDRAMSRNAEIAQGQWKVEGAAAQLRQARAARILPRLRLQSENGLVPDARGDIFNPPTDTTGFIRPLGPFVRAELEFAQPLYTFGQLTYLSRAAAGGLAAEEAALEQTRQEVAFEVKKLYFGMLLAQDLQELAEKLYKKLEEKQAEFEGKGSLSLANAYKLKLALIEVETQKRAVASKLVLARAALAWRTGLEEGTPFALADAYLTPLEVDLPPMEVLIEQALARRPDWLRLQAGIAARKAQREAARRAYYPQIFLGGGVRYAVAPGRTDQHNPFLKDEFNYFNGGVFIGLRQSFEWGLLAADFDRANAAYGELRAKEEEASRALRLDVRRAYLEFQQADEDLKAADRARQLARQWLQQAQDEYEFDPDTLKDLIAAFETWARLEQSYYQAIYDYNFKLADLEKTAGGISLSRSR